MTIIVEMPRPYRSLLATLADELAPTEGRLAAASRIALGCVVTVAIAMVFQIPQPTYMAYIVFAISKDAKNATVTAAMGALIAVSLAVILTLGLSIIDTGEAALRLPLMALATFIAMFTSRTFVLGPISYLAGFVIVLLQSLVDDVRSPEALTRAVLWIWVIVLVPVATTVVVNLLFGQDSVRFVDRTVRRTLRDLAGSLETGDYRLRLAGWRARLVPLLEIAKVDDDPISPAAIALLLDVLTMLEALQCNVSEADRHQLADAVRLCLRAVEQDSAPLGAPESLSSSLSPHELKFAEPTVVASLQALDLFRKALDLSSVAAKASESPRPRPPIIADAFSNPAHWQFALKTTIAVMISYVCYTMLNWPGLRTAIVTCFFVALGSLGETMHKLTLRLTGAAIGGLLAALCLVFVFPHLTDIGQLCLVIGAVSLIAAWVATSSEILAYGGMQIAFAFFLGALQGYVPASDLTVLRDRIAGILLGNIVIAVVFSSIWPESASAGIRTAVSAALRALSGISASSEDARTARTRVVQALARADHFRTLRRFELRMLPATQPVAAAMPQVADVERLAGAAFVLASESISRSADERYIAAFTQWANAAGDSLSQNRAAPPNPLITNSNQTPLPAVPSERLAVASIEQLVAEIQRVIAATH